VSAMERQVAEAREAPREAPDRPLPDRVPGTSGTSQEVPGPVPESLETPVRQAIPDAPDTVPGTFHAPARAAVPGTFRSSDRSVSEVVAAAVDALRRAQPAWGAMPIQRRLRVLARLRGVLAARGGELAGLSGRTDRPGWESRTEALSAEVIPLTAACAFLVRRAASILAPRRAGRRGRPAWLSGVDLEVRREPFGAVLVVAPSNYPIFLPGVQILHALAAGNGVLVKPGPRGAPAARWLARELTAAGLPEGLLSVLPEDVQAARGAVLAGVDKVVLTGSAETGAAVLTDLASWLVPATLELSGCDALVALEDADPRSVVDALAFSLRLQGGATCIAPRRAYLHRAVFAAVETGLAAAVATVQTTLPAQPESLARRPVTAPVTAPAMARARQLASAALAAGARLVSGELDPQAPPRPLVVAASPTVSTLLAVDLFAPLVTLVSVDSAEQAVALANACPFALGASVFGGTAAARRLAGLLDAGVVTVNDLIVPTADPRLPFGGRRRSGFGVTRGAEGLLEMTTVKAVTVRRAGGASRYRRLRHFETPVREDEALFCAYLAVAHGDGFLSRLTAVPSLVRALAARLKRELRQAGAEPRRRSCKETQP